LCNGNLGVRSVSVDGQKRADFAIDALGKSDIAFALNGVTRCFSVIVSRSLLIATATLILSGPNGNADIAV